MSSREEIQAELFDASMGRLQRATGQIFFGLLPTQWLGAIVFALISSPWSWAGTVRSVHPHVLIALLLGGALNAFPLLLLRARPEWWLTRHVVAAAQVLWSGLLIDISDGRIETHFHVFVSLAFISIYRDWRLLVTATSVILVDHFGRGLFWPASIYGVTNPQWWRLLEHTAWVAFEDTVLVLNCLRATADMRQVADREAELAILNRDIERQVRARTEELVDANAQLGEEMRARLHMEAELRQAHKLEAVGRLASGVAHEINTPIQFVSDSLIFVRDAVPELFSLLRGRLAVREAVLVDAPAHDAAVASVEAEADADLPYLEERMPPALDRALEGLARVTTIVRSMREFAHPDSNEMTAADLNRAIESTLVIAANEYKEVAEVECDFGPLPPVSCYLGDVNQVILNIVVNAAHAIEERVRSSGTKGRIRIRTRHAGDEVIISISDDGNGIPEAIRERIFDPFFTTKEVGKGTGQGLAIARSVVIDRHRGKIELETELGKGSTFSIRLPVERRAGSLPTAASSLFALA